jgi:hypothetical protein
MITFKQEITVPEELVIGLAIDLGWKDVIETSEVGENGLAITKYIENSETAVQFIDRLSKQHTINFFKPFGDKLVAQELKKTGVEEQVQQTKEALEAQIIKPIVEGLVTEFTQ